MRVSQSHRAETRGRLRHGLPAFPLLLLVSGCTSPAPSPEWIRAFGYAPADVRAIDVGDFGYPYVPVDVEGHHLILPFDTGNMVGVSVSSTLFDEMGLSADGSWSRLNSAGQVVASLRMAEDVDVSILGRDLGPTRVYELEHPKLAGLVGPVSLGGGHFTLDYASRRMALGAGRLPDRIPGFRKVPLVRSKRHPLLVLVRGTIEGRPILLECDTGKSRTVVNPALASELALQRGPRGVAIRSLRIAGLSFEVTNAKEVDQTGIDPDLPIMLGVGSDVLSRFVWTVDYDGGVLWVPSS